MLKSELYDLEKFVDSFLSEEKIIDRTGHEKSPAQREMSVKTLCSDLKKKWTNELLSSAKEQVIKRYVQFHQAGIISLTDQVYFAGEKQMQFQGSGHFSVIVQELEGLIKFLERNFYNYFDLDHAVTAHQYQYERDNILSLLAEAIIALGNIGIDPELLAVLNQAIRQRLDSAGQTGVSYRQVKYFKGILNLILEHTRRQSFDTGELVQLLFRQNFNSHFLERWYSERVSKVMNSTGKKNRDRVLNSEVNLLRSQLVEKNIAFDNEQPAINDSLLMLLVNEYSALAQTPNERIEKINGHKRMPLNFSVAQFALFIRMCYLEGCFHISNISTMLRFFSENFETKKQLNISLKSFGRFFYSADQATAAVVRDFLQRMIKTIDKTYFP